jgi:hypothetical protein
VDKTTRPPAFLGEQEDYSNVIRRVTETLVRAFHPNEIRQRIQGKKKDSSGRWVDNTVDYIEGNSVIDRLNEAVTPLGWSYQIIDTDYIRDADNPSRLTEVMRTGRLILYTPWGDVFKEQSGSANIKYTDEKTFNSATNRNEPTGRKVPVSVAEDAKAAATDALKKCATLFGVYNHGYRKEQAQIPNDEALKAVLKELQSTYMSLGMSAQQFLDFASGITRKTILGWGDLSLSQAQICLHLLRNQTTYDPLLGKQ